MKTKPIALFTALLLFATGAGAKNSPDRHDPRAPEVPAGLEVPEGHKVSFHAYAVGVQIYTATQSPTDPNQLVWTFTGPQAVLFDRDGDVVGIHYAYAGPTRPAWESESGSLVVGSRYAPPVTVDADAIPWLLLEAVQNEGPGIFKRTAFIQRVNTTGGLAPARPPRRLGQTVRVPYTAEYYFFRAHK